MFKLDKNSRLLLAAPSNSAADLLALRMLGVVPKSQMLRLCAYSREPSELPGQRHSDGTTLMDVTNWNKRESRPRVACALPVLRREKQPP